jgi:hypothetical protein
MQPAYRRALLRAYRSVRPSATLIALLLAASGAAAQPAVQSGSGSSAVAPYTASDAGQYGSGDGLSYVFTRQNRIWYATVADTTPRALTDAPARQPAGADTAVTPPREPADSAARAAVARERLSPVRLSHDGSTLIALRRSPERGPFGREVSRSSRRPGPA